MWLKLCLLLIYICVLFILSRVVEALSWYEAGYSGALSRQLLDPMLLSVAKLKALLEQRGVSYEGVVEKSDLTSLVDSSGQVSAEEVVTSQDENVDVMETNFTSGAHFIEQVEDAKDSVWLVQVVWHPDQLQIFGDKRWQTIRKKISKFGVRTGLLDCSLDMRFCSQKGWHSPFLLLALPSQFEKKASIAMHNYSGPVRENVVLRWVHDKLNEKVVFIHDASEFQRHWQNFTNNPLEPEIRAVLFTHTTSAPLFFSALSVKFPGRVKFGLVCLKSGEDNYSLWTHLIGQKNITKLPLYYIYTTEKNYTYGLKKGEQLSFTCMERFFKFLYPCLNDIFIISFCVANVMSWFEFFVSNCGIFRRFSKFIWCAVKYNIIVIMLWLPIIGIFQMPYLDRLPLLALKTERLLSTSHLGTILRGDFSFYLNNPVYLYVTFVLYLVLITYLCKKYRQEENGAEGWLDYNHMRALTRLQPNFYNPMNLWLQPSFPSDYVKHLPTWRYNPVPLAAKAAQNVEKVKTAMETCSLQPVESDQAISFESSTNNTNNQTPLSTACCEDLDRPGDEQAQALDHSCTFGQSLVPDHCQLKACSSHENSSQSCSGQSILSSDPPVCGSNNPNETIPHQCAAATPSESYQGSVSNTSLPSESADITKDSSASNSTHSASGPNLSGWPPGYREFHQCVICLEEFSPLIMLCGLPCGHVFHRTCIHSWLYRDMNFCPICRHPSNKCPHVSS